MSKFSASRKKLFTKIKNIIGPGIVAGAADDDPSGIATYSIAGAKFNLSMLWMALFTWPIIAIVQMMCARIGMVTGSGLSHIFKKKFSKKLIIISSIILFCANIFNISADLFAMSDAAQILSGFHSRFWIIFFAIIISISIVHFKYAQISNVLKWLVLALFTYVVSAFCINPDWTIIAKNTFIPTLPKTSEGLAMVVAILGTTISPYLFYWQSSLEVEEEIALGRGTLKKRLGATQEEISSRKIDVTIGTFFSNLVMFFIILTTALTLHKQGITNLETSSQVAQALEPAAGSFTMILYTAGLIGTGFLGIVTLAGSSAYALCESFSWKFGLDKKLKQALQFYIIIIISSFGAVGLDFLDINPIKMLYLSSILNGILAPFLLIGVLIIARDKKIMQNQPSSKISQIIVLLTILIMLVCALLMFIGN